MKSPKQYQATVEQQFPAHQEVAQLKVVGLAFGTYEECWQQAHALTLHPILTFKELHHAR